MVGGGLGGHENPAGKKAHGKKQAYPVLVVPRWCYRSWANLGVWENTSKVKKPLPLISHLPLLLAVLVLGFEGQKFVSNVAFFARRVASLRVFSLIRRRD